jgi:hypothetical protein
MVNWQWILVFWCNWHIFYRNEGRNTDLQRDFVNRAGFYSRGRPFSPDENIFKKKTGPQQRPFSHEFLKKLNVIYKFSTKFIIIQHHHAMCRHKEWYHFFLFPLLFFYWRNKSWKLELFHSVKEGSGQAGSFSRIASYNRVTTWPSLLIISSRLLPVSCNIINLAFRSTKELPANSRFRSFRKLFFLLDYRSSLLQVSFVFIQIWRARK